MLSEAKQLQKDFWNGFNLYCQSNTAGFPLRVKPIEKWHYDIRFGFGKAKLSLTCNTKANYISCEIYISDDKPTFYSLQRNKEKIERELDTASSLEWMPLEEKIDSRIKCSAEAEVNDRSKWPLYYAWLFNHANKFYMIFKEYLLLENQSKNQ